MYFSLAQDPRTNSARAHYIDGKTETQRAAVIFPKITQSREKDPSVLPTSPGDSWAGKGGRSWVEMRQYKLSP